MYTRVVLLLKYLNYFLLASNGRGHGIHSPFVFDFIVGLLRNKDIDHPGFREIELIRNQLINSPDSILVDDLGAGSLYDNSKQRSISSIAKYSLKSKKYARLLYRMVRHYQIDSVIELGTSLGITSRYLSLANPTYGVTTIEGAPAVADLAFHSFAESGINNIEVICGDFKDHLTNILLHAKGRKMIFFDGNHQYQPTIDYFISALSFADHNDIFVFDDIHWSPDMEKAWEEIKQNERVTCAIDLFFIGVVFFKKDFYQQQHYTIRF